MRALRPEKGVDAGKCDKRCEKNLQGDKIIGLEQQIARRGCLAACRHLHGTVYSYLMYLRVSNGQTEQWNGMTAIENHF